MTCEQIREDEIGEKYLLQRLGDDDRDTYELHCLACARCFEELERYRALRTQLRMKAAAIRMETADAIPLRLAFFRWALAAGLVLVFFGIGYGVWMRRLAPRPVGEAKARSEIQQPVSPAVPSLVELARVEPPAYTPIHLRGSVDRADSRFREAMEQYRKGDYREAILGLRAALELDPDLPPAHFFLGISYLMTNQTDLAIEALGKSAKPDSPFSDQAHFFLAKALIRRNDLELASAQLKGLIDGHSRLEGESRRFLEQLQAARPQPRR